MSMLFLEGEPQAPPMALTLSPDLPHYGVPELHVIDFDDNISSTKAAIDGLLAVCQQQGLGDAINVDVIQQAREDAWRRKGSYNILELLEDNLAPEVMADVRARYRRGEGGHNLAFDDVVHYANRLSDDPSTPNFILTYGENVDRYPDGGWQADKIQRARMQGALPPGYAYFMPHSRKGPVLERLHNRVDDTYDLLAFDKDNVLIAMYHARRAVLIDDRKTSLANAPLNCTTMYMRRPNVPSTPKQEEGDLPLDAVEIESFDEVPVSKDIEPLNEAARNTELERVSAFVPLWVYSSLTRTAAAV
ncbi:MAG TPA: hypothetical protein VLA92_00320 [Candidatus Saccharimonadales bacterium]|nr:hypothetical protein [Candidatus Saccharimonadales bacterium]